MRETKKAKYIEQIKSDLGQSRKLVDREIDKIRKTGWQAYLTDSNNLSAATIKDADSYFVVEKSIRYPMKAIAKMACFHRTGDFVQTQSTYYAEALTDLGIVIEHDPKASPRQFSERKRYQVLA